MDRQLYWKYVIIVFFISWLGCLFYQIKLTPWPALQCVSWLSAEQACSLSRVLIDSLWLFAIVHIATVGMIPLSAAWLMCRSHRWLQSK